MKTECIKKSIKTDLIELGIIAAVAGCIGITGWLLINNPTYLVSSITTIVPTHQIAFYISVTSIIILTDIFTLEMSANPLTVGETKIILRPLIVTLVVYTIIMCITHIIINLGTSPSLHGNINVLPTMQENAIIISVINTIIIIPLMILYRTYVRCKYEGTES